MQAQRQVSDLNRQREKERRAIVEAVEVIAPLDIEPLQFDSALLPSTEELAVHDYRAAQVEQDENSLNNKIRNGQQLQEKQREQIVNDVIDDASVQPNPLSQQIASIDQKALQQPGILSYQQMGAVITQERLNLRTVEEKPSSDYRDAVVNSEEARQIKQVLKAETGQESLTDAQWDLLVERQKTLFAGKDVVNIEEVKVEEVFQVAEIGVAEERKGNGSLVENVNWGYFGASNMKSHITAKTNDINANKAQLQQLRTQIENTHSRFNEIRESIDKYSAKTLLDTQEDIVRAAKLKMEQHNLEAGDEENNSTTDAEFTEKNGKMYLVHTVEPQDSISRLTIMYNVDAKEIRMINGLPNDMIHHKFTLNIPISEKFKYAKKTKMTEEMALKEEQSRRQQALFMMDQYIQEVQRCPGRDFKAEARYYCEESNYEYRKAKQAYDEDKIYEEEQKKKEKLQQKNRRRSSTKKFGQTYQKLHQD